jgi:maleylpyruvate isomerase
MQYKLFSYFRSSASYRVRIALSLKGLQYEIETLHLRRGDHRTSSYLELNPQGLLPALEHEGHCFTQSLAIIEYLDEIHPVPPLMPSAPRAKAIVRAMALDIACEMHPLCNLRVLQYLRKELSHDEETVKSWYRHWIAQGFDGLERTLTRHAGRFCFGDLVTLADVCLLPQVNNARRFDCDISGYPVISRIAEELAAHPAFIAAQPALQPDAE